MIFYHRTPAAQAIVSGGFRDATGSYGFGIMLTGVWLADQPLDSNEGAKGEELLEVSVPDEVDLSGFEFIEDEKGYREWCVPAALINARGTIRQVGPEEEGEIEVRRWEAAYRADPAMLAEVLAVTGDYAADWLVELARELGLSLVDRS